MRKVRTSRARRPQTGRYRTLGASLALCLVVVVATSTLASAQDPPAEIPTVPEVPDVPTVPEVPNHDERPYWQQSDREPATPDPGFWTQVGGARFPLDEDDDPRRLVTDSPTTYNDNLYEVTFPGANTQLGIAAGSTCEEPNPDAEKGCKPVAFVYTDTPERGKVWDRIEFEGSGYIGAVAWMTPTVAMAVGGTGTYPRREPVAGKDIDGNPCPPPPPGKPYLWNCDQAGEARAWLYRDGDWCELGRRGCPDMPQPREGEVAHGLTAVDFREPEKPGEQLLGFAGGLGQIWRWQGIPGAGGRFDKIYDNDSPNKDLDQPGDDDPPPADEPEPDLFNHRIRDLKSVPVPDPRFHAVTSGCCSANQQGPLHLVFYTSDEGSRWALNQRGGGSSGYDRERSSDGGRGYVEHPVRDSLYAVLTGRPTNVLSYELAGASFLASAGGPAGPGEERSAILVCGGTSTTGDRQGPDAGDSLVLPGGIASGRTLSPSTARLLALDGLIGTGNISDSASDSCGGSPDVAVGELRSRNVPGHGRQGFFVLTRTRERTPPLHDLPETSEEALADVLDPNWKPTSEEMIREHLAPLDYLTSSYTLNALEMVGDTGVGWAVGDHGALMQAGGEESGTRTGRASEPPPPRLGGREPKPLPDSSAYPDPPTGEEMPRVPALASRPSEQLDEPRLTMIGAPDASHGGIGEQHEDVAQIVMSRDGSEGWAIGANTDETFPNPPAGRYGIATFYHYDGNQWTRCDPVGIRAQLAPDPACESVATLRRWELPNGAISVTKLIDAARVPLENDSDPSNDDEFEVVAIGTRYRNPATQPSLDDPVILRYRNGRWDFEPLEDRLAVTSPVPQPVTGTTQPGYLSLKDIAFTAPDDGWILAAHEGWTVSNRFNELYHYDGERWRRCRLDDPRGAAYWQFDTELADCGAERVPAEQARSGNGIYGMRLVGAGDRVYLAGSRPAVPLPLKITVLQGELQLQQAPFILYHERGGRWTDGSEPGEDGGGFDPAWQNPHPGMIGESVALTVAQNPDGSYSGWWFGYQFDSELPQLQPATRAQTRRPQSALMMRLETGADGRAVWRRFRDPGALEDAVWLRTAGIGQDSPTRKDLVAMMPGSAEEGRVVVGQSSTGRLFDFNPGRERWEPVPSERPPSSIFNKTFEENPDGDYQSIVPDGQGGAWIALKNEWGGDPVGHNVWGVAGQVFFYHYTDRPPKPVFEETAQPFGGRDVRITSIAASPDGTVWLASDSSLVARYDRVTGWRTATIPGWDPGRVVTRSSEVFDVAVGSDGSAVAVGKTGRIANLSENLIGLDQAAGRLCDGEGLGVGCGTSRDLRAVAVAPDGSALASGQAMATLWRAGPREPFQRIPSIPGGLNSTATEISMPEPDRAWVTTNKGFVFAGEMSGPGQWTWKVENRIRSGPDKGTILGAINSATNLPLRSIAVKRVGDEYRGYAVGDQGLLLERTADPEQPWRRLRGPGTDYLTSVTLAQGSGADALIGGRDGLVWSAGGDAVEVSRPPGYFRSRAPYGIDDFNFDAGHSTVGPVVGTALLPGVSDGQTEAWVAVQERGPGSNRLLHYASEESEPLLNPDRHARPLADTPPPREQELAFAAFGKADCAAGAWCAPMAGIGETPEAVMARIGEKIKLDQTLTAPEFSLFTGDVSESTGVTGGGQAGFDRHGDSTWLGAFVDLGLVSFQPRQFGDHHARRFLEMHGDRLTDAGVPLLGTLGTGDLTRPHYSGYTQGLVEQTKAGDNYPWRMGFAEQSAPWGGGSEPGSRGGLSFVPAAGSEARAQKPPDLTVDADHAAEPGADIACEQSGEVDPEVQKSVCATRGDVTGSYEVKGGARTHYATDVIRDAEPVARIVMVDSSLRELKAAEGAQNPLEADPNGQLGFLERMLCFEGQVSPSGEPCTRSEDQEAIVLTNTPTYSYGPPDPTSTALDGAVLEALYLRYKVSAVVSGRLGWNGLYYALAPGLHVPCPGGEHPRHAPQAGASLCESASVRLPNEALESASGEAAETAREESPADPCAAAKAPVLCDNTAGELGEWMVPFVVASGAGGKFGPRGQDRGTASDGYWHGYTKVRIPDDGDPRGVVVEQRPVLDWIGVQAETHSLRPHKKITLEGAGRGPIAYTAQSSFYAAHHLDFTTAAVTHCYDLLYADSNRPWVPLLAEEASAEQLAAQGPGCANREPANTAEGVQTSAADESRCEPYVCLPESIGRIDDQSGRVKAGNGQYPRTYAIGQLSVGSRVATYPLVFEPRSSFRPPQPVPPRPTLPPPPTAPSPPPNPTAPTVEPPPPPTIPPSELPLSINPVVPPTPPSYGNANPIDLGVAPVAIVAPPPTVVLQPPNPVVQPAPPSGARREARQRQAATQKSGADGAEQESSDQAWDSADGPPVSEGTRMTRHEFAALARSEQPSALARDAIIGGGLVLGAFLLAIGFGTARPTPKRRPPEVPAPAWMRNRRGS